MSMLAGRWAILISGLLGLGAVGLLAAAVPKLGNAESPLVMSGQATRTAVSAQPARPASGTTAGAPLSILSATTTTMGGPDAPFQPSLRVVSILPDQEPAAKQPSDVSAAACVPLASGPRLDLGTAGIGELRKLPQITRSRARAIVQGRPYHSVSDLLKRKVIPKHAYAAIKDKIEIR